jgi:hypothetical protein
MKVHHQGCAARSSGEALARAEVQAGRSDKASESQLATLQPHISTKQQQASNTKGIDIA